MKQSNVPMTAPAMPQPAMKGSGRPIMPPGFGGGPMMGMPQRIQTQPVTMPQPQFRQQALVSALRR